MATIEKFTIKGKGAQLFVYRASKGTDGQRSANGVRIKRVIWTAEGHKATKIQNHPQRKFSIIRDRERLLEEGWQEK